MSKKIKKINIGRINFKDQKQRFSLTLIFSIVIFVVLFIAIALASVTVSLLVKFEVIISDNNLSLGYIIALMALVSVVIGVGITFLAIRFPLRPLNTVINKMNRLAHGEFDTRLEIKGPLGTLPVFKEISDSFNILANELENTEVLRIDFINNFSHEFKTPIVSIAGLAKLLKNPNISEEQRAQYLGAIEEESARLSHMATNVMNLTKAESQSILTNISLFNLSEQIRSSVLLLENKWMSKNIEILIDCEEVFIEGNEELLKLIWINLLDNAFKFTSRCGTVTLGIASCSDRVTVSVKNTGSEIPRDKIEKIWNKFYQADESHFSEGNGIGLAIVKKLAELHGGSVFVKSENGATEFSVELPKAQR